MFPMVLPLPRTSISFGTGAECFLAHTGSASIVSGLRVGAFPSNVTVPVTDDAASATPGHSAIATNPAARHKLGVLRILVSFVTGIRSGRTLHRTRHAGNPPSRAPDHTRQNLNPRTPRTREPENPRTREPENLRT